MPRQTHTVKVLPGAFPSLPLAANAVDVPHVAADVANKEQVALTGREIVLVRNDDVGAQTVTFTSTPDEKGRSGDITAYSVGAGETAMFGPFGLKGWQQADGNLYFEASDAGMMIAVVRTP